MPIDNNSLKRFIICYKKKVNNKYIKQSPKIIPARNDNQAMIKICDKFNIPNQKISRDANSEGIIYCNPVYNPTVEM